jgi:hypothetical protein
LPQSKNCATRRSARFSECRSAGDVAIVAGAGKAWRMTAERRRRSRSCDECAR